MSRARDLHPHDRKSPDPLSVTKPLFSDLRSTLRRSHSKGMDIETRKTHLAVTNVLITLVGTASTTHLKYTCQGILQHYSQYVLVDGFTVEQLAWMQGIKEWNLFTAFGSRIKLVAWVVIYAGMAVHSASVVSILQPSTSYKFLTLSHSYAMN